MAGRTIAAATAVTPPIAIQQHISGTVLVRVTLDDRSRVVAATVVRSPSAVLNAAAIQAAEQSTFATRIANCVPVGDSYLFSVIFDDVSSPVGSAPAAMTAFFGGAWKCEAPGGASLVRIFGLGPDAESLIESSVVPDASGSFALTVEIYDQHGATLGLLERFPAVISGTSTGWSGDRLVFHTTAAGAGGSASTGTLTYERDGEDRFVRSLATTEGGGSPAIQTRETCARIVPSP